MAIKEPKRLKVVVVGVGLAGGAVGIALQSVPSLDLQLYDRSNPHRQVGAWIGVTPTGQRLLDEWCGEGAVDVVCRRCYTSPAIKEWNTGRFLVPHMDPLPADITHEDKINRRHQAATVRQDLHRLLVDQIPAELIHLGKKAYKIEVDDEKATVAFVDGTQVSADLVVVADGINSKIRQTIYPESKHDHLGHLEHMEVFDQATLEKTIPNLPRDITCYFHAKTMVFMGELGRGRYGLICILPTDPKTTSGIGWAEKADPSRTAYLKEHFKDWDPVINQILDHSQNLGKFPLARGKWLSTLIYKDRVCFAGDAAHPTGGAYGAGCSLAFEDAKILSLAMSHAYQTEGHWSARARKRALQLYNDARHPHIMRVFESLVADDVRNSQQEDAPAAGGDSGDYLRWLTHLDCQEQFDQAVERERQTSSGISNGSLGP